MLNIAIAGAGALGKRWADVLSKNAGDKARISAVVDPLIDTSQEPSWLEEYKSAPHLRSIEQLKDLEIDAVLVITSSPSHAAAVHQALTQNYDVLVEKPFTTNLDEANTLVELAGQKHRVLMVNQNYRFFPGPESVRKLVAGGELGSIRAVAGQFWCDWPGKTYQHAMRHPMNLEMAIHHFDLVRFMFSADPVSGWVHEWNPRRSPYQTGGAVEALFTMGSNQISFPFSYSGSLVTTAPAIPWAGYWRFEFDEGTLFADEFGGDYALYRSNSNGRSRISEFGDPNMAFDKSFLHFIDCVQRGTEPVSSGRDNISSLRMALNYLK